MNIFGTILLWFYNIMLSGLKDTFGILNFDTTKLEKIINAVDNLTNIFAWVNMFVPVDFLFILSGLTAVFYGYRFILGISKIVISLFK